MGTERQLSMFSLPPHQRHSATSRAAAVNVVALVPTARDRVLALVKSRGSFGATDNEIAEALGMNPSTARPRRIELERAGLIQATGTRETASRRKATIYTAR